MTAHKTLFCCLLLALTTGCNGIMDGIYDNPTDEMPAGLPYGYKAINDDRSGGTLFFDSRSYLRWTYFNLRQFTSDMIDFRQGDKMEPLEQRLAPWDIAFHRSVPKTNGGEAAETRFGTVAEVVAACKEAGGILPFADRERLTFKADEWSEEVVTLDLSGMFDGKVVYQPSLYSETLNRWLHIDISSPPPVYTMSRRAYVLHLATGEYYAIALVNFRNANNVTAWLTIDFQRL
ncbi:MAG: HmuY family protein [Bacteroidaceae bacterium]|nr:HmuY family protein [Bacteroidaceae bacterium]